ncbi:chalcone_isomerase domain-containing protein [Haematococcus lacustris]|uniref:Chalcone_isomerase domain-containing protein n=1 Tax=Haematococcus lacustris TaxID=44745 RepID=A0A6A0AE07_HAELA|nr:chalcone_isomerase domain-containing protein [Haematococcus lacustris]
MLVEPQTGLPYPADYCVFGTSNCPQLAGLGVRVKKILGLKNINIYALGIYVDSAAAKKALGSKFKSLDKETLANSQALLDEVLACESIEKTLRLVISFGALKRSQFVEALNERLAPGLKQVG